jgi:predicted DNA-binding transcriptional regulator
MKLKDFGLTERVIKYAISKNGPFKQKPKAKLIFIYWLNNSFDWDMPYSEIAKELGITEKTVGKAFDFMVKKLILNLDGVKKRGKGLIRKHSITDYYIEASLEYFSNEDFVANFNEFETLIFEVTKSFGFYPPLLAIKDSEDRNIESQRRHRLIMDRVNKIKNKNRLKIVSNQNKEG